MTNARTFTNLLAAFLLTALCAAAQQPQVLNAKLQTRPAGAGLEKEFRAIVSAQTEPAWIAYGVPLVDGRHRMCCYSSDNCCGGCSLETKRSGGVDIESGARGPVQLESAGMFFVFFRVEQRAVEKIRHYSEECQIDAGGLPVYLLTGVRPAESVALLASFATAPAADKKEESRVSDSAVVAIALHGDPAADRALEQFVEPRQPESLRSRAAFWLGVARGRRGYELLRRMVREDPSERVRDKAVFALSQSKVPEAVEEMISVARNDKSGHVRAQALFWLAQKAGRKAAQAITDAIANDPDSEIKKRAVFALSQLPKDEGIPLLIGVARNNRNPVARKQAIFWLGQSRDPRAVAFFEEILTK